MAMTKFELNSNAFKIDTWRPKTQQEFNAAKKELLENIDRDINTIKEISLEQYLERVRSDFSTERGPLSHTCFGEYLTNYPSEKGEKT
jgi:hypothetical protein